MDDNAGNNEKAQVEHWVCGYCNCITFELIKGAQPVCANCGVTAGHEESGWMMDEAKKSKTKPEDTIMSVGGNDVADLAKARMQRRIKEDGLALAVLAFSSGEVSCWSAAETKEQYEWAKSRIQIAESLLSVSQRWDE